MSLSSDDFNVATSGSTRPHSMSDGTREGSEIGEVRVDVNGVEVTRSLAVWFVGEGSVEDGETGRGSHSVLVREG